MADISIDWISKVISVPKSAPEMDLIQSVPTVIYDLDLNAFHIKLRDLEAALGGAPWATTHSHDGESTLGGLTYARKIQIIGGYTVTFEDDQYAVNLVGANSDVADKTNVNQVSVRPQNAAGLISSPAIEYASFNGGVTIDTSLTTSGTGYNLGTPANPVGNVPDALLIAAFRGFTKLYVIGNITFGTGHDISDFNIEGESHHKTLVTVNPGAVTSNTEFRSCILQGTLNSESSISNCVVRDLDSFEGDLHNCGLEGTIVLGGNVDSEIINCYDATAGGGAAIATIDMGGSGQGLIVRNFEGGLELKNKSGTEEVSVGIRLGRLVLDSTITNGEILVRIIAGEIEDNSVGATVIANSVLNPTTIGQNTLKLIESQRGHHTATGNVFYWDPVNGLDSNDGLSPITAKLTWGGASGIDSLIVAQNHDLIIILPGEPVGTTIITEQIVIDKEYTFIRGPGRDVLFQPTATSGVTVSIEAEGVELSGMRVETAATGDGEAFVTTGDFSYVHDVWIELSRGDGIRIQNVSYAKLKDVHVRNCIGNGIVFRGTTQNCRYNIVSDAFIIQNGGDGVRFEGVNCQHNYVWGGEDGISIMENTGWGINEVDDADFNHALGPVIHVHENVAGQINFIGADSEAENIGDIPDGVLDSFFADHTIPGTLGGEVATKADIAASASTIVVTADSGTVVEGSVVSGTYVSTAVRDGTYWQIQEDGSTGITVEFTFSMSTPTCRPGVFEVFGRYEGVPANAHYQELWAWNVESSVWEQLVERFMPGGITSNDSFAHEYFERHIDRGTDEVKIRIVHNVTSYNASHNIYLDLVTLSCIEVVTAADIAVAVWAKVIEGTVTAEQAQRVVLAVLANLTEVENLGGGLKRITYKSIDGLTDRAIIEADPTGLRALSVLDGS